jgi:NAD(P)-dependent dehydrogenase (short-subunit alcohol dehydrogenase family)
MIVQDYLPRTMYKGKTVFITGGGSGINLGIVRNFAVLGASPLAAYVTGTVFAVDGGSSLVGSALWNQFVEAMDVRRK